MKEIQQKTANTHSTHPDECATNHEEQSTAELKESYFTYHFEPKQ